MAANQWTRLENKMFEEALVRFPEESPDRWQRIAGQLPNRSAEEVREYYEALVHDVMEIDSGRIDVPDYPDDSAGPPGSLEPASQISFGSKHGESERKKGTPWTEDEHRLFLVGLRKYGRGDWRSISRNVVVTRTPTQVASHAQKYFLRQNSVKKERKRTSIHDITTVDSSMVPMPVDQNWIPQPEPIQQASTTVFQPHFPPANHFPGQGGSSLGQYNYGGFPM